MLEDMNANRGANESGAPQDDLLAFWDAVPAFLYDRRLLVLEANPLAQALSSAFRPGTNLARFTFLSPGHDRAHPRWQEMSGVVVGLLRDSLDQHDEDRSSQRIIGELSAKSRDFSTAWAGLAESPRTSGSVEFEETAVGTVRTKYNVLNVPGYEDNAVMIFVPSDDEARVALERLASLVSGSDSG